MNESFTIALALAFMAFGAVMLYASRCYHRKSREILQECQRPCARSEILENEARALVKLERKVQSWDL